MCILSCDLQRTFWNICCVRWGVSVVIHSFIHSIGMCRMRLFLALVRSFFHSSLLCTCSFHPSPPTILPSPLTSSCHLFLGLPLNLLFANSYIIPFWEFYFLPFSVHAQTKHNLFNLIVSIIVGFLTLA